jgi:RNA polymerase sigma-B factor
MLRRFKQTGDPLLRERLVETYQPFARSLAQRYYSGGEPLEDLIQVANVGLLKAIDRFEPDRGKPFAAFAAPTILGELRHYFRDHSWSVRLPRRLQERAIRVADIGEQIRAEEQRTPTTSELAARCDLTEAEVIEVMVADSSRRTRSLDAPVHQEDGESASIADMVPDDDTGYERAEATLAARSARLLPRERKVMDLRYVADMTQREVGEQIGISQMQVSRLQRSALAKLLTAVRGGDEDPDELLRRLNSKGTGSVTAA